MIQMEIGLMLFYLLPFAEGDMPSTVVTPLPHLQTMSLISRDGEVRTGADQSTGESISSRCHTVQVDNSTWVEHKGGLNSNCTIITIGQQIYNLLIHVTVNEQNKLYLITVVTTWVT